LKILITGATGLVGKHLLETLVKKGYDDIRVLTRNKILANSSTSVPAEFFEWNPETNFLETGALDGVDIIIHLAGENVAGGRWSESRKKRILDSRKNSTQLLINEIKKQSSAPQKFISASAVGIYGDCGEQVITNDGALANDFLAEVCKSWEHITLNHNIPGMKSHCLRTGVVLSADGGALTKMLPAFFTGLAGRLGSGQQYMSWIHIDDLVNQYIYLIENDGKSNIYNSTSPVPVTNTVFTKILGSVIHRPTFMPLPESVLKILLGEMSDILLKGQRVVPDQFLKEGFEFKFATLDAALSDILKYKINGETILEKYQWIKQPTQNIFHFFSDENNLELITPPYLHFKVSDKSTEKIAINTLINYKLKIHGIPVVWKSKITNFVNNKTFTDVQLSGPYSKWVHQHDFIPYKDGTLIYDKVIYKIPMGIIGKLFAGYFINKDIQNIFKYRSKIINKQFSKDL
jgi:uncharacterized protein (TIGR01777 family)